MVLVFEAVFGLLAVVVVVEGYMENGAGHVVLIEKPLIFPMLRMLKRSIFLFRGSRVR